MWGGRFSDKPAELMQAINVSISFDRRLAQQDLAGSRAHAAMLRKAGVISSEDEAAIQQGLATIGGEIEAGTFPFREEFEDIHMNVEARLRELIGSVAGRLHTARSRNDQVALDFRMWVREACDRTGGLLQGIQKALIAKAEPHAATLMPGFTHLQPAQPVTFGHHLMAYVEMFGRDAGRFADARARMNESPLGAAALAGSPFPIDRQMTAQALGFDRPTANSLDSVSDRDFALEALAAGAISALHLSRLAEEIVIWSTPQFGFVRLSDAFSTGSSIMPQKRNPDGAELLRAKAARVSGALLRLLELPRGLPIGYHKDLQEDKPALFEAEDTLAEMLDVAAAMLGDVRFDAKRMRAAVEDPSGYLLATEAADWLASRGVPFREAHEAVGRLVREAERRGLALEALPLDVFREAHPRFDRGVFRALTPEAAVSARRAVGGTAPANVERELRRWEKELSRS